MSIRKLRMVCGLAVMTPAAALGQVAFSLDLGSDNCSDPFGGHGFDPGDMYVAGMPVLPGADGWADDADMFWPAGDPAPFYSGSVPWGAGLATGYFDLDGFTYSPGDLTTLGLGTAAIEWRHLSAAEKAVFGFIPTLTDGVGLLFSYDDDGPERWSHATWTAPVQSLSPSRSRTYGRTAAADELVLVRLRDSCMGHPNGIFAAADVTGAADEIGVHGDLAPSPDVLEANDDDVDALFAFAVNPPFLFSADHEATKGLNPGTVYEMKLSGGAGFATVPLITAQAMLRLKVGTDVDAIELAWMTHPVSGQLTLVLLFSVDDDDPTTPMRNESGGLDPGAVYASTMAGKLPFKVMNRQSILYGLDRITHDLYHIDRYDGSASSLGVVPISGSLPQLGATTDGRLWSNDGTSLVLVDPDNPAASSVYGAITGLSSSTDQITDMTGVDGDTLYAIVDESGGAEDVLYELTVGTAGATATRKGETGLTDTWGIAWDPTTTTLYAIDLGGTGLYEIDTSTAAAVSLGCSGLCPTATSLVIDEDGCMFAGDDDLYKVDYTGAPPPISLVGSTGPTSVLSGLAMVYYSDDIDAMSIVTDVDGPAAPSCRADLDTSTGAGVLDLLDFLAFTQLFAEGDPSACDADTSTGPGACDFLDLIAFQDAFAAGCP